MEFEIKYHSRNPKIIVAKGLIEDSNNFEPVVDLRGIEGKVPVVYQKLIQGNESFFGDNSAYAIHSGTFEYDAKKKLFFFQNNERYDFDNAGRLAFILTEDRLTLKKGEVVMAKQTLMQMFEGMKNLSKARFMSSPVDCREVVNMRKEVQNTFKREKLILRNLS